MSEMVEFDRIQIDPKRMNGQPCIRGTRLIVRRVLEIVALYNDKAEMMQEFPELQGEDIRQALRFAATNVCGGLSEIGR